MSLLEISHPVTWLALAGVEAYIFSISTGTVPRVFAALLVVGCLAMAVKNYRE
ncbi:hypothetical protein [Halospeciosus flavus]|uniref:Uncharacterized protein n=1 Tax=Halospeciosus flavus TaxID=3032283 RepID=A0ABD5Z705_9EURY|nr:hypothetical protein [Halospeciosus flavus]